MSFYQFLQCALSPIIIRPSWSFKFPNCPIFVSRSIDCLCHFLQENFSAPQTSLVWFLFYYASINNCIPLTQNTCLSLVFFSIYSCNDLANTFLIHKSLYSMRRNIMGFFLLLLFLFYHVISSPYHRAWHTS